MRKFAPNLWSQLFAAFVLATTFAQAEEPSWQTEWEKTLSAAEKEGTVTVYGQARHPVSAAIQAFTKFYPKIKLNFIGGPGSELGHRIMAEKRAGKHLVDIAIGGSGTQVQVYYKAGLLELFSAAFILPELRDETAWWGKKPHATKVYINWILSKEGQLTWQKIAGDNSLRMDIPKSMVNESEVPREGNQYIISSQHLDAVKPLRKLINQLLP